MRASMTLTVEQARAFYDRFGKRQDARWISEDHATSTLADRLQLADAHMVVELGCGTGRFARALLDERLPADCRYLGLDVSSTMIGLAQARLQPLGDRAEARQTDGSVHLPVGDATTDRLIANYVLDLLSDEDIGRFLEEAARVLRPGGLLGITSLTCGEGRLARVITGLWQRVFAWNPALLGGCRPIQLRTRLPAALRLEHAERIERFGVASEVLVAGRG
jgi:ubiquinone/menaquinone biosynthesis C-methylase UbiE